VGSVLLKFKHEPGALCVFYKCQHAVNIHAYCTGQSLLITEQQNAATGLGATKCVNCLLQMCQLPTALLKLQLPLKIARTQGAAASLLANLSTV
jgi:hypothetical protein